MVVADVGYIDLLCLFCSEFVVLLGFTFGVYEGMVITLCLWVELR